MLFRSGYVERSLITTNVPWIDRYKVFTPRSNNIGTELSDDNLNSFVGKPRTICTETYIVIGVELMLTKESAENICKYLETKFLRFMHSLAKASQDASSKTYSFVPMQDFTSNSDISWELTIKEIDEQLYNKYGLNKQEIEFIENSIKPMSE